MAKCEKCGYEQADKKFNLNGKEFFLCSVCSKFLPSEDDKIKEYIDEKINSELLSTFRKYQDSERNLSGMKEKAESGKIMSRSAFGYKIVNKELVIDEEKRLIVESIFREFLNSNTSLNKLAKKYNFSVNGIKKILRNFTYIGKIKFAGKIMQGKHQPIITPELFNKVQKKLESLGIC